MDDCGVREGYWNCSHPGGCNDCRELARDIEDFDKLKEWNEERKQLKA